MGSDGLVRIGRGDAERLIATFLPMIDWLDAHGVDYCLVGGLGVVVQSYASGLGTFRATEDADVMFDASFTNQDFARAYLGAYAADPAYGGAVYDAMFGDGAFAGLADEYYYDDQYETSYPADAEPWEPNLTTLVDFSAKWADMLQPGCPVPTPPSGKEVYTAVGVFEGGGYQSHGVYRPAQECRMKINEAPVFCPVCMRAIRRIIDYYTEERHSL